MMDRLTDCSLAAAVVKFANRQGSERTACWSVCRAEALHSRGERSIVVVAKPQLQLVACSLSIPETFVGIGLPQ
jgi:hypothetical protein